MNSAGDTGGEDDQNSGEPPDTLAATEVERAQIRNQEAARTHIQHVQLPPYIEDTCSDSLGSGCCASSREMLWQ